MKKKNAHFIELQGQWGPLVYQQRLARAAEAERRALKSAPALSTTEEQEVLGVAHVLNQLRGEMVIQHPLYDMRFAIDNHINPRLVYLLSCGDYVAGHLSMLEAVVTPGDKVLDLGAGLGVSATLAAQLSQNAVVAVEPNPELRPLLTRVAALNKVQLQVVPAAVVAGQSQGDTAFYVRDEAWSSSLFAGEQESKAIKVPVVDVDDLIQQHGSTVLSVDLQGAEVGLFETLNLKGIEKIVLVVHTVLTGEGRMARTLNALQQKGFFIENMQDWSIALTRKS